MENFKSGFCAIVGAPNVGKSTLLNRILGQKISIVSRKPQTTRNKILGIHHRADAQIVFTDTPGIHAAKDILNKRIVEAAIASLEDSDVVLHIADIKDKNPEIDKTIFEIIQKANKPSILALNKIDLLKKKEIAAAERSWKSAWPLADVTMISAKSGEGIAELLEMLIERLPRGPLYFPEDEITDAPLRFIVAEIVREKIFWLTGQEIPYSSAVTIEKFHEKEKITEIFATIHVERDSQKGIVIGKGAGMLKKIGEESRRDIEELLQRHVMLKLFVRVQKNWSKDTKALVRFGY